jgi:hypothetical protein
LDLQVAKWKKESLTDRKKNFVYPSPLYGEQNKNSNYFLLYHDKDFKEKKAKQIMECMHKLRPSVQFGIQHFL